MGFNAPLIYKYYQFWSLKKNLCYYVLYSGKFTVMRTAYKYKLRPNKEQIATIELWLDLLRRQYNYRLGERFSWWE